METLDKHLIKTSFFFTLHVVVGLPPLSLSLSLGQATLWLFVCAALDAALMTDAQYAGCDYTIDVASGQSYSIYSPYYSGFYPAYTQCRWTLTTTPGSRIALSCSDVAIPLVRSSVR